MKTQPNINDPVLCYVRGHFAYFTPHALSEQWGDDWNDAPYEHNAGRPYTDAPAAIVVVAFESEHETPDYGHTNSPYSVEQINAGSVPWLRWPSWRTQDRPSIPAGTPLSRFIEMIEAADGTVYQNMRPILAAERAKWIAAGFADENGEPKKVLSFASLRSANLERAKEWNPSNTPVPLSFAMMELAGETGEACNEAKKLARTDLGLRGGKTDPTGLAEELADVAICTDLAAIKAGIDLEAAVIAKFNATSNKYGLTVKLDASGVVGEEHNEAI